MSIRAGRFLFRTEREPLDPNGGDGGRSTATPDGDDAPPNPPLAARSEMAVLWKRDRKGEDAEQEQGDAEGDELGFNDRVSGDPLHEIEIRDGENTGELAIATEQDIDFSCEL